MPCTAAGVKWFCSVWTLNSGAFAWLNFPSMKDASTKIVRRGSFDGPTMIKYRPIGQVAWLSLLRGTLVVIEREEAIVRGLGAIHGSSVSCLSLSEFK